MNYKEGLVIDMKLKVGDIVEFKNYEDMVEYAKCGLSACDFPKYDVVTSVSKQYGYFEIKSKPYSYYIDSVKNVFYKKYEKFIVQDDHYGMYVSSPLTLTTDKNRVHIFNSRNEANEVAAAMHLNAWDVIPYDD